MNTPEMNNPQIAGGIEKLQNLFGAVFTVWLQQDGSWGPASGKGGDDVCLAGLLQEHYQHDQPTVVPVGKRQVVVMVPILTSNGGHCAVVGYADINPAALAQQLAATVCLVQDWQLPATDSPVFMEQLAQTMEESTWLRRLARHFEFRDVRHSVREVAREVLPELHQLLRVGALGLVPVGQTAPLEIGCDFDPMWCGQMPGEETVAEILQCYAGQAVQRAVVVNRRAMESELAVNHGIDSLILVKIASTRHRFGWLLALNRELDPRQVLTDGSQVASSETEFGTVQTSLVEAAAAMLATHARNATLFEAKERLLLGVISAMSGAVDARDPYTAGHSERVANLARAIAHEMGMDRQLCQQIYVTGLLHDIGKLGVPDAILNKTGELSAVEFTTIMRHPEIGCQILEQLNELSYVLPGVLHHHEMVDGTGYPHGLAETNIPLAARILAVADAYDAMTTCRPYRGAMSSERAEEIIRENAGTQWDPVVVAAFFRCIDGKDSTGKIARDCENVQTQGEVSPGFTELLSNSDTSPDRLEVC
jgi:putative nucleotidyltransferase with HDIG domain